MKKHPALTSSHPAAECECDMDFPGPSDIEGMYEQLTELVGANAQDAQTGTAARHPDIMTQVYYPLKCQSRSPCAGAALDPPLWIVPNKALSLSLSLPPPPTRQGVVLTNRHLILIF
jgi:hypothetical protein